MNLRLYESLLHQKIVDERRANFDVESSKMGQTYEVCVVWMPKKVAYFDITTREY